MYKSFINETYNIATKVSKRRFTVILLGYKQV